MLARFFAWNLRSLSSQTVQTSFFLAFLAQLLQLFFLAHLHALCAFLQAQSVFVAAWQGLHVAQACAVDVVLTSVKREIDANMSINLFIGCRPLLL